MSQPLRNPDPNASEPQRAPAAAAPTFTPVPEIAPQVTHDPMDRGPVSPDEARRSFLRMVSHELRTPLNAIIGFSEIVSQGLCGPIDDQYKEYGEIIRVSGHRMLKLVNQVLEIVKLESGSMEFDPRAEPLDHVFADAERMCFEDLAQRNVEVLIDLPEPVPAAFADARALRTALANLLQNAAAYAPEGGVVRLVARNYGPLVHISVEDDGAGLDPAQVPRLMQPFEQGENALVRRTEGAGLGWPVVKLLTKAMGGRFDVETAPGRGLKAILTLRRAG